MKFLLGDKKEKNWICTFCILMAVVFCLFLIISAIMLFCSDICIEKVKILNFDIMLSSLALAFAIAVATPYFISKNQVKSVVRKYLETEYKADIETNVEKIARTDAHLSRMIALLLMEKEFYYWAIGWGFRSLKRYKNIPGEYVKTYAEFHGLVLRDIILKSLDELKVNPVDRSAEAFNINDEKEIDKEVQRIKIRAIKDYVDFEYEIREKFNSQAYTKGLFSKFADSIEQIESSMKEICKNIYENYFFTGSASDRYKSLKKEIFEISTYKNEAVDLEKFIDSRKLLG